jgi:hypothetical protein
MHRRILATSALALAIGACETEPPAKSPAEMVKTRAAVDFDCKERDIHTITLDDRTKKAWGCGHQAVYVESCEQCGKPVVVSKMGPGTYVVPSQSERCNCTWVMDSHRAATAPSE